MAETTMTPRDLHTTLERLNAALISYGDPENVAKIGQLEQKWRDRELTLAFLGHFSAGKSSLINALCGGPILPSGPLPTTANAAVIRSGERRAEITLHANEEAGTAEAPSHTDGRKIVLDPEDMQETLAVYCKDGEAYATVEIWDEIPLLDGGGAFLDTPGVDSTDAAHASATDAALHLADIVFYVMDYNHVQSETNLAFAKSLSDLGKPLYLIINQVDKHREEELSFADYRESVERTFADWRIGAAGVLYLSVKYPRHPLGGWNRLTNLIGSLLGDREELLERGIRLAASDLIDRHIAREREDRPAEAAPMSEEEEALEHGAEDSLQALQRERSEIADRGAIMREALASDLNRTLDNAPIMPASLRDLVAGYLEASAPGFKAGGLFGSKRKTEQERSGRLETVTGDFAERVEAGLDVHVRERLRAFGRELGGWDASAERELEQALPRVESGWISSRLKEGARLSPEYVMNFSGDLRADALARFRRAALEFADRLLERRSPEGAQRLEQLEREIGSAEALASKARIRREVREELDLREARLREAAGPADTLPELRLPELYAGEEAYSADAGGEVPAAGISAAETPRSSRAESGEADSAGRSGVPAASESPRNAGAADAAAAAAGAPRGEGGLAAAGHSSGVDAPESGSAEAPAELAGEAAPAADTGRLRILHAAADRLQAAAALLAPLPAFGSAVRAMRGREASLRGGRFTLALFGAFSAGKSSFANALLGDHYLPVSPHPTTAAISRIMAPEGGAAHGQALVVMKTREELLGDLADACELLGLGDPASGRWREEVRALTPERVHPSGRAHYGFLRAADAGYDGAEPLLGAELTAGPDEFRLYAADETRACFVKRIDLYIDSPLTRQGIVLVDTPGADSVHARHTGVTFDYMKNADALVFVTYYNHAFSRADRQFLAQLGRVKGSDTVDKTFFIVNAADLADSPEECGGVTGHLEERLRGEGILNPRIYPVSSLQALRDKRQAALSGGAAVAPAGSNPAGSAAALHNGGPAPIAAGLDRFADFERELMHFAAEELAGLAAQSADREIEAAAQRLREWIEEADRGEEARALRREELERSLAKAAGLLREAGGADKMPELIREIRELLFHVRQRIELRFSVWFAESFNPALLHTGGGDLKASFLACGRELSRMIARETENELLATGLRIERAGERMLTEEVNGLLSALAELGAPFDALEREDAGTWQTPEVSEVQLGGAVDWNSLWPMFKNPKAFFEQKGRDRVREAALVSFREALQSVTEGRLPEFEAAYGRQLADKLRQKTEALLRRAEELAEGTRLSLSDAPDTQLWARTQAELAAVFAGRTD
ncbi:dynamin family protein [Saccharibacillus sp. CPCC 101409]|uniref:dynamin family protein n=1 Tax=Saccharibacillus sp. CPCC 101409 TaxID=3058041 RepID=UPI0026731B1D|nr:dynamin family protein [Saccharibacillus sp. CPCC 101409]MDO3409671.1 dynamin family protein [Saccharibacillus sp. CPCC 101409]